MIRRANEVLNRLENPQTTGRSTANDGEQLPEESLQTEEPTRNIPLESSSQESPVQESPAQESSPQESSSLSTQPDPDSLNVYVKHTFKIAILFYSNYLLFVNFMIL